MSETGRPEVEDRLDAYLDGLLNETERGVFEAQAERDPGLSDQIARQRRIDGSLRRLFDPPLERRSEEVIAAACLRRQQGSRSGGPAVRLVRRLAVAAVLALGVFSTWQIYQFWRSEKSPKPGDLRPWRSLETVYRDVVAGGFKPEWVCENDRQFATFVWSQFGQGLLLAAARQGVAAVGWSYCNSLTPNTAALLARVDRERVIVFVDRAESASRPSVSAESGLHLFHRRVGGLILYELTPLGESHLLDLFYEFEPPEEWKQDSGYGTLG